MYKRAKCEESVLGALCKPLHDPFRNESGLQTTFCPTITAWAHSRSVPVLNRPPPATSLYFKHHLISLRTSISIISVMRARYKGPSGTGVLQLPDDATVQNVLDEIRTKTGISRFVLKHGPPMAMKTIELKDSNISAVSLGLHGETLTVVPDEASPDTASANLIAPASNSQSNSNRPRNSGSQASGKPEDINVPWPEREGTLCKCLRHEFLHPFLSPVQ
jgi:hypothetical protein